MVGITLSSEERATLQRWAHDEKSPKTLELRSRIVLAAASGASSRDIAASLGCHPTTVGKWRSRFADRGLDGLHDDPRPGKPRKLTDAQMAAVVAKTLGERPPNARRWSTRSMAEATGLSQTAISRIWRAAGLKPHLSDDFTIRIDRRDNVDNGALCHLRPPGEMAGQPTGPLDQPPGGYP